MKAAATISVTSDITLDITGDVCPITFVKTKLLLEKTPIGAIVAVRLKGAEPLENVPRSVRAHGHEVVSLAPEIQGQPDDFGPHILIIRRN
jgi:TusA-related sulfurtransferase